MAECNPCDASGSAIRFGLLGTASGGSVEDRLAALEARPTVPGLHFGNILPDPAGYPDRDLFSVTSEPALYVRRTTVGGPVWTRLTPAVPEVPEIDVSGYVTLGYADAAYASKTELASLALAVRDLADAVGSESDGAAVRAWVGSQGFATLTELENAVQALATPDYVDLAVSAALSGAGFASRTYVDGVVSGLLVRPSPGAVSAVAGLGGSESDMDLVAAAQVLCGLLDACGVVRRSGTNGALPPVGGVGSLSADALLARYATLDSLSGYVTAQALDGRLSSYAPLSSLSGVVRYGADGSESSDGGNAYWNLLCTKRYARETFAAKSDVAAALALKAGAEDLRQLSLTVGNNGGKGPIAPRVAALEASAGAGGPTGGTAGRTVYVDGPDTYVRWVCDSVPCGLSDPFAWYVLQDGCCVVAAPRYNGSLCLWGDAVRACMIDMERWMYGKGYGESDYADPLYWGGYAPNDLPTTNGFLFNVFPWTVCIPARGLYPLRDGWPTGSESDSESGPDAGGVSFTGRRFALSLPNVYAPVGGQGQRYCRFYGPLYKLNGYGHTGGYPKYYDGDTPWDIASAARYDFLYDPLMPESGAPSAEVMHVGVKVFPRQVGPGSPNSWRPVTVIPGRGVRLLPDDGSPGYYVDSGEWLSTENSEGSTFRHRLVITGKDDVHSVVRHPDDSASVVPGWPWAVVEFEEVAPDTFLVTASVGEGAGPVRSFDSTAPFVWYEEGGDPWTDE